MSATDSDAFSSPGEARPSLGSSVGAILAGWYRAARSASGSQRVRALAFHNPETREYGWNQQVIHLVFTNGKSQPATTGDLDQLARAISYGWFLVYLQAGEGQEASVLHQPGKRVPSQSIRLQDLALLLQERELPAGSAAVSPRAKLEQAAALDLEDILPPAERHPNQWAWHPSQGLRPQKACRRLAPFIIGGEGILFVALLLLFTRSLWLSCLGALTAVALLNIFLRRWLGQPRIRRSPQGAQQQMPSDNR